MSALEKSEERREFRRISDAIALRIQPVDEAANEQEFEGSDLPDHPTHVVSLSPNGLKCYHNEGFDEGEELQVSFKLFPSQVRIDAKARVVNAGEDESSGKSNRFFAGLAFVGLGEDVKAQLLAHIDLVARESFGGAVKLVNRA